MILYNSLEKEESSLDIIVPNTWKTNNVWCLWMYPAFGCRHRRVWGLKKPKKWTSTMYCQVLLSQIYLSFFYSNVLTFIFLDLQIVKLSHIQTLRFSRHLRPGDFQSNNFNSTLVQILHHWPNLLSCLSKTCETLVSQFYFCPPPLSHIEPNCNKIDMNLGTDRWKWFWKQDWLYPVSHLFNKK